MFSRSLGEAGGDLADHVRHVGIGDRDAAVTGPRQHGLGEVDGMSHVAVFEEVAQRVGDHDRAVFLGLAGRRAEVRQRHDLGVILDRGRRKIADVAGQLAGIERREHRRFVDDLRARES